MPSVLQLLCFVVRVRRSCARRRAESAKVLHHRHAGVGLRARPAFVHFLVGRLEDLLVARSRSRVRQYPSLHAGRACIDKDDVGAAALARRSAQDVVYRLDRAYQTRATRDRVVALSIVHWLKGQLGLGVHSGDVLAQITRGLGAGVVLDIHAGPKHAKQIRIVGGRRTDRAVHVGTRSDGSPRQSMFVVQTLAWDTQSGTHPCLAGNTRCNGAPDNARPMPPEGAPPAALLRRPRSFP